MKNAKSNVGGGANSVAAVGNDVGSCEVAVGGAGGDIAVAKVTVAAGADTVAFFAGFFLLEGAGMFSRGKHSRYVQTQRQERWDAKQGLRNAIRRVVKARNM